MNRIRILAIALTALASMGASQAHSQEEETIQLTSYEDLVQRVQYLESQANGYASGDCCESCGDCCEPCGDCYTDCCDPCGQSCGALYLRAEAVWIKPHFGSNVAFVQDDPVIGADDSSRAVEFEWDYEISPRIVLGYLPQPGGLGWRARWWHFDNDTSINDVADSDSAVNFSDDPDIELDGDTGLLSRQSIDLHVVDLELVDQRRVLGNSIVSSAGFRYARVKMEGFYTDDPIDFDDESIFADNDFEGTGPTISTEIRHSLGSVSSMLNQVTLFANFRGSLLYGKHDYVLREFDGFPFDSTNLADVLEVRQKDALVPVGEVVLGADLTQPTNYGDLFLRFSWESQYWGGIGTTGANEALSNDSDDFQAQRTTNMGFSGFSVGGGISR